MKPFAFYGAPHSPVGLPDNLTPARLSALAWVRSNFPENESHEILDIKREGSLVTITLPQEIVSFDFKNEVDAARAVKQLPPVLECQSQFMLAADIDMEALSREMNFGAAIDDRSDYVAAPAPAP